MAQTEVSESQTRVGCWRARRGRAGRAAVRAARAAPRGSARMHIDSDTVTMMTFFQNLWRGLMASPMLAIASELERLVGASAPGEGAGALSFFYFLKAAPSLTRCFSLPARRPLPAPRLRHPPPLPLARTCASILQRRCRR